MMGMYPRMLGPMFGESEPIEKAVGSLMEELLKSPDVQAKVRELAEARVNVLLEKAVDRSLANVIDRIFGYDGLESKGLRDFATKRLGVLLGDGTTLRGALEAKVEAIVLDRVENGKFVENWTTNQLTQRLSTILEKAVTEVAKRQTAKANRAAKKSSKSTKSRV